MNKLGYSGAALVLLLYLLPGCQSQSTRKGLKTLEDAQTALEMGAISVQERNYDQAEAYYAQAEQIITHILGFETSARAVILRGRGNIQLAQNHLAEAEALFGEALPLAAQPGVKLERDRDTGSGTTLPPDLLLRAGVMRDLARVYEKQRRWDQAAQSLEQALQVVDQHSADKLLLVPFLRDLERVKLKQKDFPAALGAIKRTLAIEEKALGPDHEEVASTLTSYATLLRQTGNVAEADEALRRSREIRRRNVNRRVVPVLRDAR